MQHKMVLQSCGVTKIVLVYVQVQAMSGLPSEHLFGPLLH